MKKMNIPHMKYSLHKDELPGHSHPPGLKPTKTKAKPIGEIRKKAKKCLPKAKGLSM